jgi:hypothetical protein
MVLNEFKFKGGSLILNKIKTHFLIIIIISFKIIIIKKEKTHKSLRVVFNDF